MKNVFVNEAFTIAINDYLNNKNSIEGVKLIVEKKEEDN